MGKREPKAEKTKLTVEVPTEIWRKAKMRALDERTDLRSVVIAALENYCKLRVVRKNK